MDQMPDDQSLKPAAAAEPALSPTDVVRLPRLFSYSECQEIIALADERERVQDQYYQYGEIRGASQICWVEPDTAPDWLRERIAETFRESAAAFDFDISGELEDFKLMKYRSGNRIGWHVDCGGGNSATRKLTFTALLSQPGTFEGGVLTVPGHVREMHRDIGDVVIFPSFLSHKVTSLTRGTRYSLIAWAHGPRFR